MLKSTVGMWMGHARHCVTSSVLQQRCCTLASSQCVEALALRPSHEQVLLKASQHGRLLSRDESVTRQSKVINMIQVLNWDLQHGELHGQLQAFD